MLLFFFFQRKFLYTCPLLKIWKFGFSFFSMNSLNDKRLNFEETFWKMAKVGRKISIFVNLIKVKVVYKLYYV